MLRMSQESGDWRLCWFTAANQLRTQTAEEHDWILDGYLAPGAITLLAGKPKAGKSTLAWAIAEAVSAGSSSFLGRGLRGWPVVYVSEKGVGTLRHKLPDSPSIWVMTRETWPKPSWAALVGAAVAEAWHRGALILVVDALGFWAVLAESEENKSGAVQAVMDELLRATDIGLAVLLVHHQRKGGGKDGDAVRGSNAIVGAVDVLVELERLGEGSSATHRRLVSSSRWPAPPALVVEQNAATRSWHLIGEAEDRAATSALGWRERLLQTLPKDEPGLTLAELKDILEADPRKWHEALKVLIGEGLVRRLGGGRKGDPHRHLRSIPEIPSQAREGTGDEIPSSPHRGKESTIEPFPSAEDEKDEAEA